MNIVGNIVLFLEFLFQGYCVYVYMSSLLKSKKSRMFSVSLFLCASVIEFAEYRSIELTLINIGVFVFLTFIVCMVCFENKMIVYFLHTLIISAIFAMFELLSIPFVNIALSDNYIHTHSDVSEMIVSTVSKLFLFIFCKIIYRVSEKEMTVTSSIYMFIVPVLSLLCELAICCLADNVDIEKYNLVVAVCSVSLLVTNMIVFGVHENFVKIANETAELKLLEQKKELDYEYYKILQNNYDQSRILVHDIKHHVAVMGSMAESGDVQQLGEYILSLKNQKYINEVYTMTGNKIIDIIIYQKSGECSEYKIKFHFKHNNINFNFIEETDICCILCNILDNAIDAAKKSENKFIDMEFYTNPEKDMYFIEVCNGCDIAPVMKDDRILTDKENKEEHGVGLYSVELTAQKYNGFISFDYSSENNQFLITVTLKK